MDNSELKYESSDIGPFEIRLDDSEKTRSLGSMARLLCKYTINFANIEKNRGNSFSVTFKNYKDANSLIGDSRLKNEKIEAFIPRFKLVRKATVRGIPCEVPIEEIIETINCENRDLNAFDAYRITKRIIGSDKQEFVNTETVVVFLRNQLLPKNVILWRGRFDMKPFVNRVRMCFNCQKIGHTQKFCKSPSKCIVCTENKHPEGVRCVANPKCVNCDGAHRSNDRSCPIYLQHDQINKIMAYDNVSFQEAKKKCTIINCGARATMRMDDNDLRDFPALRPVSDQRERILRNTFGDAEGRATTDNHRTSRGSFRDMTASTTTQGKSDQRDKNLGEEEVEMIIKKLQAAEGTDSTVPLQLIETLVGELVRRILLATEKSSFFTRLFKTADLHNKHGTK